MSLNQFLLPATSLLPPSFLKLFLFISQFLNIADLFQDCYSLPQPSLPTSYSTMTSYLTCSQVINVVSASTKYLGLTSVSWMILPEGELIAEFTENRPPLIYGKHSKHAELSKKKKMPVYLHKKPSKSQRKEEVPSPGPVTDSYKYLQNKQQFLPSKPSVSLFLFPLFLRIIIFKNH